MKDPVRRGFNGEFGSVYADVERSLSSTLSPKATIMSPWLTARLLSLASHEAYRTAADDFNRDTFRDERSDSDGAIRHTTLQYMAEKWGGRIHSGFVREASLVLGKGSVPPGGATMDGMYGAAGHSAPGEVTPEISAGIGSFNEGLDDEFRIKDRTKILDAASALAEKEDTVCISYDGVLQHKQRDTRSAKGKNSPRGPRKWLEIVDTSMTFRGKRAVFPAKDQREAGALSMAVAIANGLGSKKFAFFADGSKTIRNNVMEVWGSHVRGYYLDPFHLQQKIDEKISLGMKAKKEEKAEMRSRLFSIIWAGNVDDFLSAVRGIQESKVKNKGALDNLANYVDERRDIIPCYALRSLLGLKNSSNDAELANRTLVTQRGKNAAMSWSKEGSMALAAITACNNAGQLESFITGNKVSLLVFKDAS